MIANTIDSPEENGTSQYTTAAAAAVAWPGSLALTGGRSARARGKGGGRFAPPEWPLGSPPRGKAKPCQDVKRSGPCRSASPEGRAPFPASEAMPAVPANAERERPPGERERTGHSRERRERPTASVVVTSTGRESRGSSARSSRSGTSAAGDP